MKNLAAKFWLTIISLFGLGNQFAVASPTEGAAYKAYASELAKAGELLNEGIKLNDSGNFGEAEKRFSYIEQTVFAKLGAIPIDFYISVNLNLGFVAANKNDWDKALQYYFKALVVAKQEKDWFKSIGNVKTILVPANFNSAASTANILTSIALAYDNSNRTDVAKKYYEEEITLRTRQKDFRGVATAWRNIGIGAQRRKDWVLLQQAGVNILASINGLSDTETLQIYGWEFVAQFKWNNGDIDGAKRDLSRAIALDRAVGDTRLAKHLQTFGQLEKMQH